MIFMGFWSILVKKTHKTTIKQFLFEIRKITLEWRKILQALKKNLKILETKDMNVEEHT